jgi:hypothetical protein
MTSAAPRMVKVFVKPVLKRAPNFIRQRALVTEWFMAMNARQPALDSTFRISACASLLKWGNSIADIVSAIPRLNIAKRRCRMSADCRIPIRVSICLPLVTEWLRRAPALAIPAARPLLDNAPQLARASS